MIVAHVQLQRTIVHSCAVVMLVPLSPILVVNWRRASGCFVMNDGLELIYVYALDHRDERMKRGVFSLLRTWDNIDVCF